MGIANETPRVVTLAPGALVGEYRVERKLGEGGMASVFGAVHPLIGKRAAIKVMSPSLSGNAEAVRRFMREARAVNRIGHPNIVDVFSFGVLADGRSYFVMEWLKGESLFDHLWRQHRMPLPEALSVLLQICDALEAAHDNGIVHRDLKPGNVFLTPIKGQLDRVKLLDFGVAKLLYNDLPQGDRRDQTGRHGRVLGTPEYIAPEQARGRDVDARADLYSLGVMAYEMVLGRLPFLADNPYDQMQMHVSSSPPQPRILWPDIPPLLEKALLRLLAKEPDARLSLNELRRVLSSLLASSQPSPWQANAPIAQVSMETTAVLPPKPPRPRHLGRFAAVVSTFIVAAVIGYRPHKADSAPVGSVAGPVATITSSPFQSTAAGAATGSAAASAHPTATRSNGASSVAAATGNASPTREHARARRHVRDANYLLDPFASR